MEKIMGMDEAGILRFEGELAQGHVIWKQNGAATGHKIYC